MVGPWRSLKFGRGVIGPRYKREFIGGVGRFVGDYYRFIRPLGLRVSRRAPNWLQGELFVNHQF